MAVIATLRDNFTDLSRDTTKWSQFGTTTTVSQAGSLVFTTTTTNGYGGYTSVNSYDLVGSCVTTRLVNAGNQALASLEIYIIQLYQSGNVNSVFWYLIQNSLRAYKRTASTSVQLQATTYDSTIHKFFRIRESGGTTYFDYSTDSVTWVNFTSLANPFVPTALFAEPSVGTFNNEASGTTVTIDEFNLKPLGTNPMHLQASSGMSSSGWLY